MESCVSALQPEKRRGSTLSLFPSSGKVEREKIKDRRVTEYTENPELGT